MIKKGGLLSFYVRFYSLFLCKLICHSVPLSSLISSFLGMLTDANDAWRRIFARELGTKFPCFVEWFFFTSSSLKALPFPSQTGLMGRSHPSMPILPLFISMPFTPPTHTQNAPPSSTLTHRATLKFTPVPSQKARPASRHNTALVRRTVSRGRFMRVLIKPPQPHHIASTSQVLDYFRKIDGKFVQGVWPRDFLAQWYGNTLGIKA